MTRDLNREERAWLNRSRYIRARSNPNNYWSSHTWPDLLVGIAVTVFGCACLAAWLTHPPLVTVVITLGVVLRYVIRTRR